MARQGFNNYPVENRRHYRVGVDHLFLRDSSFTPIDLSESGMKLYSFSPHSKGEKISLKLNIDGETLVIQATVVWSKKSLSIFEDGYYSGVQFSDHSISQQLLFRDYVMKRAEKEI